MSDVLEVRPGSVGPAKLDAFQRALEAKQGRPARTPQLVGPDGERIELPKEIHTLLVSIVETLKAGNGVSVIPLHAELTTVEAADLLNVSRPFLIKQLDRGAIAHHMVGTHRRLNLVDVLAYRDQIDATAADALDAMAAEAEELGVHDE